MKKTGWAELFVSVRPSDRCEEAVYSTCLKRMIQNRSHQLTAISFRSGKRRSRQCEVLLYFSEYATFQELNAPGRFVSEYPRESAIRLR